MTKSEEQRLYRDDARETLRNLVKPGDTVYTILRHVSRSGMQRTIGVVVMADGKPFDVTGWVGKALGWSVDRDRWGVKVGGAGMDMGFHLVYSLSWALWPDGFGCVGEGCPSSDHGNGDRSYAVHHKARSRAGYCTACGHNGDDCHGAEHWHKDGGYALRHRWL